METETEMETQTATQTVTQAVTETVNEAARDMNKGLPSIGPAHTMGRVLRRPPSDQSSKTWKR
jgi:hypothetical protein